MGGKRVAKNDARIEAYGSSDELNSWIGLLRDQATDQTSKEILLEIQDRLFTMGSLLAAADEAEKFKLPSIDEKDIELLEKEMDKMNEHLPEMRNFILPGGHPLVSQTHIARCVCRRAERNLVTLASVERVPEILIRYLNRLSDFLFVLSRKFSSDLNSNEIPWKPRV